jgi:hypothetical protein
MLVVEVFVVAEVRVDGRLKLPSGVLPKALIDKYRLVEFTNQTNVTFPPMAVALAGMGTVSLKVPLHANETFWLSIPFVTAKMRRTPADSTLVVPFTTVGGGGAYEKALKA